MENHTSPLDKLIEKVEAYSKTTLELYKCNVVAASAEVVSNLAAKLVLTLILIMFVIMVNIGAALWIGELLNQPYYGFFAVALFYLLLGFILYLLRNEWIKVPISNKIIESIMKEKLL